MKLRGPSARACHVSGAPENGSIQACKGKWLTCPVVEYRGAGPVVGQQAEVGPDAVSLQHAAPPRSASFADRFQQHILAWSSCARLRIIIGLQAPLQQLVVAVANPWPGKPCSTAFKEEFDLCGRFAQRMALHSGRSTRHNVGGREGELLIVVEEVGGVGRQLERAHALERELLLGPDLAIQQGPSGHSPGTTDTGRRACCACKCMQPI